MDVFVGELTWSIMQTSAAHGAADATADTASIGKRVEYGRAPIVDDGAIRFNCQRRIVTMKLLRAEARFFSFEGDVQVELDVPFRCPERRSHPITILNVPPYIMLKFLILEKYQVVYILKPYVPSGSEILNKG